MKQRDLNLTATGIQVAAFLLDAICINAVFLLAFAIRYGVPFPEKNFDVFKENFFFLTFLYLLAFTLAGVFKKRFICNWNVVKAVLAGMASGTLFCFMFVYLFRFKWAAFPSSVILIALPVGAVLIAAINVMLLRLSGRIYKCVAVIGRDDCEEIVNGDQRARRIYLSRVEDIPLHDEIDEVVLCEKVHEDSQLNLLLFLFLKSRVNVVFAPALYADLLSDTITEKSTVDFLATFIGRKSEWEEFLIRLLDIVSSVLLLVLFLPVMAGTAIMIKVTSPGPVFYRQKRSGKDGRVFMLIKFRTMVKDAESRTGPMLASKGDARIIPVGRFLRQTRLDELPQLLNVLAGHMSMVGPRPERPHFTKIHKALRGIRMAVRPGLTGLAQIRSSYDVKPQHKIKYDYLYIQRRSVRLNLFLMWKTIPVLFSRNGC